MTQARRCSRTACTRPAETTLTYVYADSTAVLGPLAAEPEPHSYDLCVIHAQRMTAPRGWEIVRLDPGEPQVGPRDDLEALADAVREPVVGRRPSNPDPNGPGRRGHLRVLPSPR